METVFYLHEERLPYVRKLACFVSEESPDEIGLIKVTLMIRNGSDAHDLFAAGLFCGLETMKQSIK